MPHLHAIPIPVDSPLVERSVAIQAASDALWPGDATRLRGDLRDGTGYAVLVHDAHGTPVATGTLGPIHSRVEPHGRYAGVWTVPGHRRRGAGAAAWDALVRRAAADGVTLMRTAVAAEEPDGLGFALRRGFRETSRDQAVRLDLTQGPPSPVAPPPGITLTSLTERPDLLERLPAAEAPIVRDIPNIGDVPFVADVAGWRERFRDGTFPADTLVMALDGDEIVGIAYLHVPAGAGAGGGEAWHDLTGTRADHRGRGIATALKTDVIRRAAARGVRLLHAANDVDNVPMRAVNARLGFVPTRVHVSLAAVAPFR